MQCTWCQVVRIRNISRIKSEQFLYSGIVNGVSAYGCMELRSIILQQHFLSIDMSDILDKYMKEEQFRYNWDNLQRQYFCCGTFNFNIGYTDWKNFYNNNSVPDSCCHIESPECGGKINY